MKPKGTILVVPINAVGHVNACAGALETLRQRNQYRIIFLLEKSYKGKLESRGFEEFIYDLNANIDPNNNSDEDEEKEVKSQSQQQQQAGSDMANALLEHKIIGAIDVEQQRINLINFFMKSDGTKHSISVCDQAVRKAIELFQPDLFVVDNCYLLPAIYYSQKPWIHVKSLIHQFYCDQEDLPPWGAGLSINADPKTWEPYRAAQKEFSCSKFINDHIESMGYQRYPNDIIIPPTESLSVYATPEELNYDPVRAKTNWINLEVFQKVNPEKRGTLTNLGVPQKFLDSDLNGKFSGKLVYLSLGSMGSVDLDLMRRLVRILGSTNHKYIVSKGPRHLEYELAANMWGKGFLPQTDLLPWVDLVITHGGNNTTTETFAVGKPMVVMPLFSDQHDNAQRLHETGLGVRVKPYSFEDNELVEAIDRLLYDQRLNQVLQRASQRIQNSNVHQLVADRIEEIIQQQQQQNR